MVAMSLCKSLDEIEKAAWNPGPSLLDLPLIEPKLEYDPGYSPCNPLPVTSLNGEWEMAPDGYTAERTAGTPWPDAIPAQIPGTVHTALFENGLIPDPMVGKNDKMARENSYRTWWLRRRFSSQGLPERPRLTFDGVCYRAQFWLNGTYLGEHLSLIHI